MLLNSYDIFAGTCANFPPLHEKPCLHWGLCTFAWNRADAALEHEVVRAVLRYARNGPVCLHCQTLLACSSGFGRTAKSQSQMRIDAGHFCVADEKPRTQSSSANSSDTRRSHAMAQLSVAQHRAARLR